MIELIAQLFRFGIVGVTSACVHFSIVVFLVQNFSYAPLVANAAAFMVSFQISYWGHRSFTFNGTDALHRVALPKLLFVQILNFFANESLYYIFLSMHITYWAALLMVLSILPMFTFVTSKLWIFK